MEREVLFGNSVRLPSADIPSSCELELLKLLREVDMAFLEKHRMWRSKHEKAEALLRQKDTELQQAREEISQLTNQIQCLETFQGDMVNKYDKRIADLKNDVVKIKKRYQSLRSAADNRCTSEEEVHDAELLEREAQLWRSRAVELEKQLRQVEDDVEARLRELYEEKIRSAVADKEGVIDRLSEKVLELTKTVRELEISRTGFQFLEDGEGLVEEALRTFEKRRSHIESEELDSRIRGHMQELMSKLNSDREALKA
uniref:Putative centrosomal protein of 63 kDa n=1 Tax=Ornithodoros turicata TaxID=34597 RepID=A0A2R5LHA5_9ACAR